MAKNKRLSTEDLKFHQNMPFNVGTNDSEQKRYLELFLGGGLATISTSVLTI